MKQLTRRPTKFQSFRGLMTPYVRAKLQDKISQGDILPQCYHPSKDFYYSFCKMSLQFRIHQIPYLPFGLYEQIIPNYNYG